MVSHTRCSLLVTATSGLALGFILGFFIPIPFYWCHRRWPKAGFHNFNPTIITYYIGYLCVEIISSVMAFFVTGFISQFYIRNNTRAYF